MKTFKFSILLVVFTIFSVSLFAQEKSKNQAFSIHEDHVKPSMVSEYEELAVEFNELLKKYNPDIQYLALSDDQFTYSYVSPIDNMGDLDKNYFADSFDDAGKEKAKDIFDRMDKCYDTHGNHILILDNELSYMPDGISQTQEGMDYRTFYRHYYTPGNYDKLVESVKAAKAFFTEKGSKRHFRIYRSGFGVSDAFFLVAISSKDAIHNAEMSKENRELLGPEQKEVIGEIFKYTSRFEASNGWIRPDLSYKPSE